MPLREVTLKEVAEAAGVHYSTASRALDPTKGALVNPSTAAHVQAVAHDLGYRGHMGARNLRTGRSNTVGIVIPELSNPFWAPVLHGVSRALDEGGYVGLIGETRDIPGQHRLLLDRLASWRVDAIVTGAARLSERAMLQRFSETRVPIVLLIRATSGGLPFVVEDGRAGSAESAQHLIDLGHRIIAQLAGPQSISNFVARRKGFLDRARATAGITIVDFNEAAKFPSYAEGRRLMKELLRLAAPRPTGVFAHNDLMAIGAIDAAREAGLDCPHDVSIIGYNDSPLVDHVSPPLSTLRIPMDDLGYVAGTRAIQLVQNPKSPPPSVSLRSELVPRGSTRAIAPA